MTLMLPINTTFEQWANDLNRSCPSLSVPFPHKGVNNWRDWARQLVGNNRLNNMPDANTSQFPNTDDWKKWAFLFIQNVQTTALVG